VLRGLKTLSLRLERQQRNARAIAEWLVTQPQVARVLYPGLETHPGRNLLESQASGFGSIISFEVKDPGLVPRILEAVKVFLFAESLGGVESLITFPAVQTHMDMGPEVRSRLGISESLLRLSVGIETEADLIADLAQALGR
jgi:cystathionine gamma-synthase